MRWLHLVTVSLCIVAGAAFAGCDDDDADGGAPADASPAPSAPVAAIEVIAADFIRAASRRDASEYASFWPPDSRQDVAYYEDLLSRTPDDVSGCDVDGSETAAREGNGGIYVDVTFPEPCGDSGLITGCEVWLRRAEGQWWVAQYACTKRST